MTIITSAEVFSVLSVVTGGELMGWKAFVGTLACVLSCTFAQTASATPSQATMLTFGERGSDADAEKLIELLEHDKEEVRAHAATGLAKLGADAHGALITKLDQVRTSVEIASRESNGHNDLIVSDYIFYSFISSWDDPGPSLMRWANSSNSAGVWHFVTTVLGTRGVQSLPYASALVTNVQADRRDKGFEIASEIGPRAYSLIPTFVSEIDRERDEDRARSLIHGMRKLGPDAQIELLRIAESHPVGVVRSDASYLIEPNEEFVARQLAMVARPDAASREIALRLLAAQSSLPAAAVRPILDAQHPTETWNILGALSRIDNPTMADGRLLPYLSRELDDSFDGFGATERDLATLTLLRLGREGREVIIARLRDREKVNPVCQSLEKVVRSSGDESFGLQGAPLMNAARLLARSCVGESSEHVAFSEYPKPTDVTSTIRFLTERQSGYVNENRIVCADTQAKLATDRAWVGAFTALDWGELEDIFYECGSIGNPALAAALLGRLNRERERAQYWTNDEIGLYLIQAFDAAQGNRRVLLRHKPFFLFAASSDHRAFHILTARLLPSIAGRDRELDGALASLIASQDTNIALQAATLVYEREEPAEPSASTDETSGSRATAESMAEESASATREAESSFLHARAEAAILFHGTAREVSAYLDKNLDRIRPPNFILNAGGGGGGLPKFPWPPPRYSSMLTFGQEVDRNLLGSSNETLGTVQKRLTRTLARIDPGFESGLFSAPGGFVMLTRLEQITEGGRGLSGNDRWRDVRPPPRSLSDILVRLFAAPPGYYRSVAFVFTSARNFGQGNGQLPDHNAGGRTLPAGIAKIKYGERNAHAIIYSFRRRDTGSPRMFKRLSALQHLNALGLISALSRR